MKNILFVVNDLQSITTTSKLASAELNGKYHLNFCTEFPANISEHDLVVLWNYRKKITGIPPQKNVMVFHSSDLPEGRGWAPIYYTLYQSKKHYTITGFLANDGIDTGDIVVKASFLMRPEYTAAFLRSVDDRLTLQLIDKVLGKFPMEIHGVPQTGEGTWNPRRKPEDSRIDPQEKIYDLMPHLRGCESGFPAFFEYHGIRYKIHIEPDVQPVWPDKIDIFFPIDGGE